MICDVHVLRPQPQALCTEFHVYIFARNKIISRILQCFSRSIIICALQGISAQHLVFPITSGEQQVHNQLFLFQIRFYKLIAQGIIIYRSRTIPGISNVQLICRLPHSVFILPGSVQKCLRTDLQIQIRSILIFRADCNGRAVSVKIVGGEPRAGFSIIRCWDPYPFTIASGRDYVYLAERCGILVKLHFERVVHMPRPVIVVRLDSLRFGKIKDGSRFAGNMIRGIHGDFRQVNRACIIDNGFFIGRDRCILENDFRMDIVIRVVIQRLCQFRFTHP